MIHGNFQTVHSVAKIKYCSPQTDDMLPLLKTTPTQFIEHDKVNLVLLTAFIPMFHVLESSL